MKIISDINILRKRSEDVVSIEEARVLIKKLEETLGPVSHGAGLAAIQLGYPKKIAVIKNKNNSFVHLINPELIEKNDEFVYFMEGCLSFPNVFKSTNRYKQITIKNKKIVDNKFEDEMLVFYYSNDTEEPGNDGIVAIAVQHELDHFCGKLILDYNIKGETIEKTEKKIGRNEPCPCGSGKKYKKCCGK